MADTIEYISAKTNPALAAALASKKRKDSKLRKVFLISGGVVAIALVVTGATYGIKSHNANKSKAQAIAQIKENPRAMRDVVEAGLITREEARDVMQQTWEEREEKTMDAYFALAPGKEREKYLDKLIDEQTARRAEMEKQWRERAATRPSTRPTSRPTSRPTTRQNRDPAARQRQQMESGDPARKAQRAAFRDAMRQRMAQRGITMPQGGRGGRGGGGGGPRGGR